MCWQHLRPRLREGDFVHTRVRRVRNEIREVGTDYVVVRSERTGRNRRIEAMDIDGDRVWNGAIKAALRDLASCGDWI